MTVQLARLGDICEINPRLPRDHGLEDDSEVSFVPMAAVSEVSGTIESATLRRYAEVKKGYTSFSDGDVLFAKITPCMENGKAALATGLAGGRGFGSTEFHVLRSRGSVLPEWIYYFVRRETFRREAKRNFTGTAGQQRVPTSFLEEALIPVPPLEEQRRIVDLLARAEGIVRLRREAQQKAAELIPAIFIDMFGDPATNPNGWPVLSMGELVGEFRYGTSQKSGPVGVPVLRIPNVVDGAMDLTEVKLVSLTQAEHERLRLVDGDLLFVRTNGNPDFVGRCSVYDSKGLSAAGFDGSECVYASYLIRARLADSRVSPAYLQAYLSSRRGRQLLRERAKTSAGQFNLNIDGLGSLPVPVPLQPLQRSFAERLERVGSMSSLHRSAQSAADASFQSLLARAFA